MTTRRKRTSKRSAERGARAPRSAAEVSVRWSRILSAQARIAAGYYELEEVRESVVDALLDEMDRR
jgi:hypothetical protein